ncbi:MAG: MBL fold metallo-hydrolase [Planctomycetota bacterium]|jgi:7,8-dihydropterin-6-yl-methyl-4-(beta-D-ribofuranosyl)aminobenzene 5'-phosphate synthase
MRVLILYDNRAREGYRADWGFACLIEGEQSVLFDTGADPAVLAHNMAAAGVSVADVDSVVLSHDHWAHTGGLPHLAVETGPGLTYILESFGPQVRAEAAAISEVKEVSGPFEVAPGIHTTGPVSNALDEQALWLETENGIVLITGCGHPGVDTLLYSIEADGPVHGVLGGFHGFRRFEALEGIPFLAPCHCTQFRKDFEERFPESFHDVVAGSRLKF